MRRAETKSGGRMINTGCLVWGFLSWVQFRGKWWSWSCCFQTGCRKELVSLLFHSPLDSFPSVCVPDLQASQSFEHYSISDQAMDYRILHMDGDQDRMYVGCKDHILSMDINNVTDGTLKVDSIISVFHVSVCIDSLSQQSWPLLLLHSSFPFSKASDDHMQISALFLLPPPVVLGWLTQSAL